MSLYKPSYSHFIHEAHHARYHSAYDVGYLWSMLKLSREMNLTDSRGKPTTLGWVVGFLAYFDLFPSVAFTLDSLADIHQLSGWDDADNYAR